MNAEFSMPENVDKVIAECSQHFGELPERDRWQRVETVANAVGELAFSRRLRFTRKGLHRTFDLLSAESVVALSEIFADNSVIYKSMRNHAIVHWTNRALSERWLDANSI